MGQGRSISRSDKLFKRLIYGLLFLTGIQLLLTLTSSACSGDNQGQGRRKFWSAGFLKYLHPLGQLILIDGEHSLAEKGSALEVSSNSARIWTILHLAGIAVE